MGKIVLLVLASFIAVTVQHSYNLGECPNVTPMADFDMYKMLGTWYVIRKTSTSSSCIAYNFTSTGEPDTYEIEQISHTIVPGKHAYHYTGELTVPNNAIPASMKVKFPLNFGSASYTVFMTDYDNYAGIFTCQKLAGSNRQSVSIISRRRDLPVVYLEKIQNRLRNFNINPYDLSIISQKNCAEETDGRDISIDSDTFSIKSVAGVVRKAGEKLGDGIEYIASGAKKLYKEHVADSKEDQNQKTRFTSSNTHPDAEWFP
ncbi:hypothetical protein Trydic_g2403 [Trypoxylus dichotomus]